MIVFITDHLIVRHLQEDDFDALQALCGNPEAMQYMGDGKPLSPERTRGWIQTSQANYQKQGYGCFAITSRLDERLIGFGGLVHVSGSTIIEIIYAFEQSFRGKGLATEFARVMIATGFQRWKLLRIEASIDPSNAASLRVIQKLAFTFVRSGVDEHNLPTVFYALDNPA